MTRVKAGAFILELKAPNLGIAMGALSTAGSKLPILTKMIERGKK